MKKATNVTKAKDIKRNWHLFDAKDQVLGRLAVGIAQELIGKKKPYFVGHLDCGDYVVVVNARNVRVTGKKEEKKIYTYYSGYPGGLRKSTLKEVRKKKPQEIIKHAVSGMLPKNKLRDRMLKRLFIYADGQHSHKDKFKVE